jgi:multidrug resistance efflux pump
MLTKLDEKKFKAELLRVQAAKAEMEYIIAQRMDEIARLQDNITKQEDAERILIAKIKGE